MAIPSILQRGLSLPVIAAPMFLVSGPELVKAACRAGVIGTFPSLNARPLEALDQWMADIKAESDSGDAAPWGVNLIVHPTNTRLKDDLDLVLEHQPPLVITSVGHPGDIAEKVHGYGGVVFHDVIHMKHAYKAAEAGVDGIIAVCAGAGGHAGLMNPFTFIPQLKDAFDKTIILAGTLSDGRAVRAAEVLGADFSYMGTRFIATRESAADQAYRQMIEQDGSADIVYTDKVSGIRGNFLKRSLEQAGLDPETGQPLKDKPSFGEENARGGGSKAAWKEVWSAGQGVGQITDSPSVADLVARLKADYDAAR
ncbi:NAD(P)H-dependent flavin oxidoreductase [Yunchengibacter salinarum]|uniref:NAD(P)H-dependent flavin oxidoreductase n=1 Tax=Yunchengibacter salinarum TaxID=3133399 RepID=UPI0035B5F25E